MKRTRPKPNITYISVGIPLETHMSCPIDKPLYCGVTSLIIN